MSLIDKYPSYNKKSKHIKRGLKDTYSIRSSSPILSNVINILILTLMFILILNCLNLIRNYNNINDYKRQLAAQEREESVRSIQASTLSSLNKNEESGKNDSKALPYIMPCKGTITSKFGGRTLSISRGKSEFHYGLDISNSSGTEIKASGDGVVEFSGWQNGYGNVVIIKHNETYATVYGHNQKLLVRKGDTVKRGQTISLMGSTGRSTGPHVHFEIRVNNKPVNPLDIVEN